MSANRWYAQAHERFLAATAVRDPDAVFFALFETLNWAHAVDDVISKIWVPRGKVLEYGWRKDPALAGGDELSNIMSGLRYVRNRVHHQWADALVADGGLTLGRAFAFIGQLLDPPIARRSAPIVESIT